MLRLVSVIKLLLLKQLAHNPNMNEFLPQTLGGIVISGGPEGIG